MPSLRSDVAVALGYAPRSKDKVYLTVREIASYGVVSRGRSAPSVTVEEVVGCINDLRLDHYAVRDGQLVYDPIPIREALSTVRLDSPADVTRSYERKQPGYIASVLRGRIKPGQPGQLPSQPDLLAEFGVSVSTIYKAIRLLRDDGLVVSKPGKGTFVV